MRTSKAAVDKKKAKRTVESTSIVYVEWVDAVADIGWENISFANLHLCHTIGYLIDETENALLIASTLGADYSSNARMHIPKGWITKRRTIKLETKQRQSKRKITPAVGSPTNPGEVSP